MADFTIQGLCREYRIFKDSGDDYGSMLSAHFDLIAVMCERGDDIPDAWHYQPGAMGPEKPSEDARETYGPYPSSTLEDFGDLLSRGVAIMKERGKDY